MLQMIRNQRFKALAATLALLVVPAAAQAGTINIIFAGLDVQYFNQANGFQGAIYDSIAYTGGGLQPSEADPVSSATFQFDAVDVDTVVSPPSAPMYGDFRINDVGNPLTLGFHEDIGNNGGGFGFDWFTAAGLAADHLRLGMTDIDVLVLSALPAPGVFFFAGTATILSSELPFGLAFTSNTVSFSYTATQVTITGSSGSATKVMAVGALTITGEGDRTIVPEPAAIALGCVVASCGLLPRRRPRA